MALTKPQFSRHLRLDPIARNAVRIPHTGRRPLPSPRKTPVLKSTRGSLPPLPRSKWVDTGQNFDESKLQRSQDVPILKPIYPPSTLDGCKDLNGTNIRVGFLSDKRCQNDNISPSRSKSILWTKNDNVPSPIDPSSKLKRGQRVSFMLPQSLNTTTPRHTVHGRTDVFDVSDYNVLFSKPSLRKYHATKQDTTSDVICKLPILGVEDTARGRAKQLPAEQLLDKRRARYKTLQAQFDYDFRNSTDRGLVDKSAARHDVQLRREKATVIRAKASSRSPSKQEVLRADSVVKKARILLQERLKERYNPAPRRARRRRVLYLPALAAPCSEEFAITMRRSYGKRFVSSPAVLDHVVHGRLPFKSTAALLDAIVRPPSTPTIA
ncbi:unnamed protein product [Clavelina lepadiformis]|uniref:Uncharacterized protein n=1 Tax=Clavelina lepadiformis TaxID=159417 RepID=A0ABP0EX96_CLALP